MAVRVGDYKFHLEEQHAHTMQQWQQPFVKLRLPTIINLRRDPFERADYNSNTYWDWMVDHIPQMYLMQKVVAEQIKAFEEFPPRQKPASFNLDAIMRQVSTMPRPTSPENFPLPTAARMALAVLRCRRATRAAVNR
jgi:arylsulfatase